MQSFLGSEPSKGLGSLILTLLGRFDLTKSLIALAIVVTSMGWGFPVGGTALGAVLGPAERLADGLGLADGLRLADGLGLAESWGGLAEGSGVG